MLLWLVVGRGQWIERGIDAVVVAVAVACSIEKWRRLGDREEGGWWGWSWWKTR